MDYSGLSNMMQHYLQTKEKYKDCIVFYRLGDFYEMFFDDAIKVSKMLDLTLTGKDCGMKNGERAPMCGIPYHAADSYVAKLVSMGEKIAVCEQLSDPKLTRAGNLVERDVIRIISAGTVTEDSLLQEDKNNYICSLYKNGDVIAMAWTDITTGDFSATQFKGDKSLEEAKNQLVKLAPSEIICNEEMLLASKNIPEIKHKQLPAFSNYTEWAFNLKQAENNLCVQFSVTSLAPYGISGNNESICAAGALIKYLKDTQKHALANILSIKYIRHENYMVLDSAAIRNLELVRSNYEGKKFGSLLWLLDKTATGMGARLMNKWVLSPLNDIDAINYRLDGVEELTSATMARMSIKETLREIKDIERLSGKVSNGNLMPRDCLALADSLRLIPSLNFQLSGFSSKILSDIRSSLIEMPEIVSLLENAISEDPPALMKDGGYIKAGYSSSLDELRNIKSNSTRLIAEIEARERERTGIQKLKIKFNRVFGYFIEISNSYLNSVPADYVRRQTLTTGERFITPELKELEDKILNSEEASLKIEAEIYLDIKEKLIKKISEFQRIARGIAALDCITSFAAISKENKYVRPKIIPQGGELTVIEGRHPVVEALSREKFVPNDVLLDGDENRTMIITGPNMAGKSTYMRQTALITLMAHIGCFVPAKSATIPIVDRIFTRVGASDNLILDQSTFMVEMSEIATILKDATADSLLILDEVGRGTSTYDGLSIAWAVTEYLTQRVRAKTMFATHYHELTELEGNMQGVKNYRVTVKEIGGSIVFLRKIVRGGANKSFGIEVAALAGVPREVTEKAKKLLKKLETSDIAKSSSSALEIEEEEEKPLSEVEQILKDTDVNSLSPVNALVLLSNLKDKVINKE